MATLPDFRANVLQPLLRGESLTHQAELTLFAAELDRPLAYLFESDRWDEIAGAARRLAQAWSKAQAVLSADGYTAEQLLHSDAGSLLALVHDRGVAEQWAERIERAVAAETDIVTVSTLTHSVTTSQIANGLYRPPRAVVGVPGVHDYQETVNRYYGLSSPSTVPKEDAIAQRSHFGEVVELARGLLTRARESREIVPFYETLPFAERCASCRTRPAERLADGEPICGVCLRKRHAAAGARLEWAGLVWLEAVSLDRALEQQRTPAAYRRLYTDIDEALHVAVPNRLGATVLAAMGGWMLLALPADKALEAGTSALEAITLHYGLKPPAAFIAAVALGGQEYRALYDLTQQMTQRLRRAVEGTTAILDVRVLTPGGALDRFRKPYTLDEVRRLMAGATILGEEPLPDTLFPDLAEQAARGNAGLYYVFERSKLPEAAQQTLKRLERAWDAGSAPGPRFFTLLTDAIALARLNQDNK